MNINFRKFKPYFQSSYSDRMLCQKMESLQRDNLERLLPAVSLFTALTGVDVGDYFNTTDFQSSCFTSEINDEVYAMFAEVNDSTVTIKGVENDFSTVIVSNNVVISDAIEINGEIYAIEDLLVGLLTGVNVSQVLIDVCGLAAKGSVDPASISGVCSPYSDKLSGESLILFNGLIDASKTGSSSGIAGYIVAASQSASDVEVSEGSSLISFRRSDYYVKSMVTITAGQVMQTVGAIASLIISFFSPIAGAVTYFATTIFGQLANAASSYISDATINYDAVGNYYAQPLGQGSISSGTSEYNKLLTLDFEDGEVLQVNSDSTSTFIWKDGENFNWQMFLRTDCRIYGPTNSSGAIAYCCMSPYYISYLDYGCEAMASSLVLTPARVSYLGNPYERQISALKDGVDNLGVQLPFTSDADVLKAVWQSYLRAMLLSWACANKGSNGYFEVSTINESTATGCCLKLAMLQNHRWSDLVNTAIPLAINDIAPNILNCAIDSLVEDSLFSNTYFDAYRVDSLPASFLITPPEYEKGAFAMTVAQFAAIGVAAASTAFLIKRQWNKISTKVTIDRHKKTEAAYQAYLASGSLSDFNNYYSMLRKENRSNSIFLGSSLVNPNMSRAQASNADLRSVEDGIRRIQNLITG